MPAASLRPHYFVILHAATPGLPGSGVPVPLERNCGIGRIRLAAAEPRVAWRAKLESRFALLAAEPRVAGNSTTSTLPSRCLRRLSGSPTSSSGWCRLRQAISPSWDSSNLAAASCTADLDRRRYTDPGSPVHTRSALHMGNTDRRGNNRDSHTHTGSLPSTNPSPNQRRRQLPSPNRDNPNPSRVPSRTHPSLRASPNRHASQIRPNRRGIRHSLRGNLQIRRHGNLHPRRHGNLHPHRHESPRRHVHLPRKTTPGCRSGQPM